MDEKGVKLPRTQREILKKFRSNMEGLLTPYDTDDVLLKWLRVKNFDLRKAERHFRQICLHRKMFDIDNIVDNYITPKVIQKYARLWFLGFAKDGTPIRYACFNADLYGFLQSLTIFEITAFFNYFIECDIRQMREHNAETGMSHHSILYVFDLDGYSYQDLQYKTVFETVFEYLRLSQEYYPEQWKYIFFINAPYFFEKLAFLFKPVLRKTFMDKIKIISRGNTKALLREHIDDDVLPAFLGGKRVDSRGDPLCREHIRPYGKIPEEFYFKNSRPLINVTDPGVEVVTINAKSCFNVSLVVKEPETTIRVEFRTDSGSLNFTILYREFGPDPENPDLPEKDEYIDPNDDNSNVLMVGFKFKFPCQVTPADGTCTAVYPGIYILQFDNTFSWFGSRKLYYRITVTHPTP